LSLQIYSQCSWQLRSPNSRDNPFTAQNNSDFVALSRDGHGNIVLSPGYDIEGSSIRSKNIKSGISTMKREVTVISGRNDEAHSIRVSDPSDHI
jgi:hypothetical protein